MRGRTPPTKLRLEELTRRRYWKREALLPTLDFSYEGQRFLDHIRCHGHVPSVRIVDEAMEHTSVLKRLNHVQSLLNRD